MQWTDFFLFLFFMLLLIALSYPLGKYIYKIEKNEKTILTPVLKPLENTFYYITKINAEEEQNWQKYTLNLILFSFFSFLFTYFILHYQSLFFLNPQNFPDLPRNLSLNTAISFLTNTDWQAYAGESTLSHFSQMVGLTPLLFLSSAIALAALFAIMRGLVQEKKESLGNFYTDLTRVCLYILFPLSFILALFYISQGAIQNILPNTIVTTLEGLPQTITQGPVASQTAIEMLGTNGGGFFNANTSHPFQSPTALVNFIQILSAALIPSALVFTYGKMTNHMKHAWSIWMTMAILFLIGLFIVAQTESQGNSLFLSQAHLSSSVNMEGKEMRFGIPFSSLFENMTTSLSLGAVSADHSSHMPLSGLVFLFNMMSGEIIFGGIGSGLYTMIMQIIIAVFIAGLMVGRTPEYLGKKIETTEVKLALYPLIGICATLLISTTIACLIPNVVGDIGNLGPHAFTQILYNLTSATQNNGSSMGPINANHSFWTTTTSVVMLLGRYLSLIPILALAGSMSKKKIKPQGENSFPVYGGMFVTLLIFVILILGGLAYFPAISLGSLNEHLQLIKENALALGGK